MDKEGLPLAEKNQKRDLELIVRLGKGMPGWRNSCKNMCLWLST